MSGGSSVVGRVMRTVGGIYWVEVAGEEMECSLRGRLKRERDIGRVAVGDEVEVEQLADGGCVISGLRERSSRISRRSADGRREQIIAANVDQLAAVFSVRSPDPGFSLLDRFLVLAESSEIGAFIVVNKIDLTGGEAAHEEFRVYEDVGYPVVYVSAKTGSNLGELSARLAGRVTLFVGPSGAGKSSLLNALQPGLGLRVGEVSRAIRRGRHTTVGASLQRLKVGGYVVDTPGLGKMQFWEIGTHELDWCFPEFRPHLGHCRYPDCIHMREPDCAIAKAVTVGDVSDGRYASYVEILEEQGPKSE